MQTLNPKPSILKKPYILNLIMSSGNAGFRTCRLKPPRGWQGPGRRYWQLGLAIMGLGALGSGFRGLGFGGSGVGGLGLGV